jgi:hypothetical protein
MFNLKSAAFALTACLNLGAPVVAQAHDADAVAGYLKTARHQLTYRNNAREASAAMVNIVRVVNSCEITVTNTPVEVKCGVPAHYRSRWLTDADAIGRPEDIFEVSF